MNSLSSSHLGWRPAPERTNNAPGRAPFHTAISEGIVLSESSGANNYGTSGLTQDGSAFGPGFTNNFTTATTTPLAQPITTDQQPTTHFAQESVATAADHEDIDIDALLQLPLDVSIFDQLANFDTCDEALDSACTNLFPESNNNTNNTMRNMIADYADAVPELEDVALPLPAAAQEPVYATCQLDAMFEEIPELEDVDEIDGFTIINGDDCSTDVAMDAVVTTINTIDNTPSIFVTDSSSPDSAFVEEEICEIAGDELHEQQDMDVREEEEVTSSTPVCVVTCSSTPSLSPSSSSSSLASPFYEPLNISVGGGGSSVYGSCASPASSVYSSASSQLATGMFFVPSSPGGADEKRRRVSQVSISSFCSTTSSGGDWSPASSSASQANNSSDSDYSQPSTSGAGGGPMRRRGGGSSGGAGGGGRRSRYSAEDRRERKKAQNRTAAERYRLKKRAAEDNVGDEERQLMDSNGELRTEVTRLEAELSCLKGLMREMLLAKGIKIPPPPPPSAKTTSTNKRTATATK